jgi:putative transposase
MPPAKGSISVERRREFVQAVEAGTDNFAALCQRFHFSRQTGYRYWRTFQSEGLTGLMPRCRAPHHPGRARAGHWREELRRLRLKHPRWGPKKLATLLARRARPSLASLGRWLRQMGLSSRRRRRPRPGPTLPWPGLTVPHRANEVWTVDFKGSFCTGDGTRLHPLTVRDLFSRFVLCVSAWPHQRQIDVRRVFTRLFRRYGVPQVIRCDNGVPWASTGPLGLSSLSVWWWRLGIEVEFTAKGHPEHNASHEQHHRILKNDTANPPASNPKLQQQRFQRWCYTYNYRRPHEALNQQVPARHYRAEPASTVPLTKAPAYQGAVALRRVHPNGEIVWEGRRRFIGDALAAQSIGLYALEPGVWSVRFLHLELGHLHRSDPGAMRPARLSKPQHV